MKKYLSLGGGVNSVAMLLLLLDAGERFEVVFCDTGLELPETYNYINLIDHEIAPVTTIKGSIKDQTGKNHAGPLLESVKAHFGMAVDET
ncbi:hypothetical protein ES703_63840 [subsurface metagenome]